MINKEFHNYRRFYIELTRPETSNSRNIRSSLDEIREKIKEELKTFEPSSPHGNKTAKNSSSHNNNNEPLKQKSASVPKTGSYGNQLTPQANTLPRDRSRDTSDNDTSENHQNLGESQGHGALNDMIKGIKKIFTSSRRENEDQENNSSGSSKSSRSTKKTSPRTEKQRPITNTTQNPTTLTQNNLTATLGRWGISTPDYKSQSQGLKRGINSTSYTIREALIDFDGIDNDNSILRYKRGDQIIQTSVVDENGWAEGALKKYDRRNRDPKAKLTGRFRVNFTQQFDEIKM